MTRHRLLSRYDSGVLRLAEGELVTLLEADRLPAGQPPPPAYQVGSHQVWVKSRHGKRMRLPRSILSLETVPFCCHVCNHPGFASYTEFISHLVDMHLRLQLLGGLDMGRSQPSCPFPSCTATSWPIVDNLLLHYASDHHVIEKIMFFETEAIIRDLRKEVATKDEIVESLLSDNAELKEKVSSPARHGQSAGHELEALLKRCCELEGERQELQVEVGELRARLGKVKFLDTPTTSPDVTSTEEVIVNLANVRSYEDGELEDEEAAAGALHQKAEDMKMEVEEVRKQNVRLNMEIAEKQALVESSQKIIQAMTEETAALKERERQTSRDLLEFEKSLSELASEKEKLVEKLTEALGSSNVSESEDQMSREMVNLKQENQRLLEQVEKDAEDLATQQEQLKGRKEMKRMVVKVQEILKQVSEAKKDLEMKYNSVMEEYSEAIAELKVLRGILDAGGGEILEMKRELVNLKKTLALRCSEMESKEGVVKRLNLELKKHAVKKEEEQWHKQQEEGQFNQVTETLEVKIAQLEKYCEEGESMKEKEELYSQCQQHEAEVKIFQENMKETAKLIQAKEDQLVYYKNQEEEFIQEIKKLKAVIHAEESAVKKLEKAEEVLEKQRRRLQLKDQEILGYQRKLELALFVPQMGGAFPQGEAWDLSLPRVKSEYQELEPEQRCGGRKRKQGDSSQSKENTSTSPAMDISNTSMSSCSKEERFKAIKREEQSANWNCNPGVDISNSSMSSSFTSKEEHSVEEKALAIKEEDASK